ncbi:MAG: hypothetical protein ACXAE3_16735 [Candidatus Kariarchaeaceae archaeon]|jgi:hypothetical protein
MTGVITYRTREDGFLIVLVELTQSSTFLAFLLDPWKAGYRDFDQHKGSLKDLKRKLSAPKLKFHEIPKKEAALLLRQNVEIANHLGIDIDEDAMKWMNKLGVMKIDYKQALYRCFNCERNDLSTDQIDEILAIASREITQGAVFQNLC